MTIKNTMCSECGRIDLTGEVKCTGQRLCPKCAAKQFNTTEEKMRIEYERLEKLQRWKVKEGRSK